MLIFPKGDLYLGDEIQPFKTGIGLIAVEGGVPVVPMRVKVTLRGWPGRFHVIKRSKVDVVFGDPIRFEPGDSYRDVTERIQEAVISLER